MSASALSRLCLAAFAALNTTLASAIEISIFPSDNIVDRGTPVDILLKVSGLGDLTAPSLGAFDVDISYDPAILGLVSVIFGDPLGDQLDLSGLGSITATTLGLSSVNLTEVSLDPADLLNTLQPGEFFLAALTFSTLNVGESALLISVNDLADAEGNALRADIVTGGRVAAVIPVPNTAWLMSLVLLPGLLRRHLAHQESVSAHALHFGRPV